MYRFMMLVALLIINTGCSGDKKSELPEAYLKAQTCREQGNPDKAESMAKSYLQQYPEDADMKLLLASVYYQKKDYASAKALLIPAIQQYPNYADLSVLLKRVQDAENEAALHPAPTMDIGAPVLNNTKDLDKAGIIARANELKRNGEFEAANTLVKNYLRVHPFDIEMQLLFVNSYYLKTQRGLAQSRHPCE